MNVIEISVVYLATMDHFCIHCKRHLGPSIYDVHTEGEGGPAQVDTCGQGEGVKPHVVVHTENQPIRDLVCTLGRVKTDTKSHMQLKLRKPTMAIGYSLHMCARHVDSTNPGRSNLVFRSKPIAEAEMSNRLIRRNVDPGLEF